MMDTVEQYESYEDYLDSQVKVRFGLLVSSDGWSLLCAVSPATVLANGDSLASSFVSLVGCETTLLLYALQRPRRRFIHSSK